MDSFPCVSVLAAIVMAVWVFHRLGSVDQELENLKDQGRHRDERLKLLERALRQPQVQEQPAPAAAAVAAAAMPQPAQPPVAAPPVPPPAVLTTPPPLPAAAPAPLVAMAREPAEASPQAPEAGAAEQPAPPTPAQTATPAAAAATPGARPSAITFRPDPDVRAEAPDARSSFDWEVLVGVKLFSWVAGIALVVGAVSFLRYSIDHGWLKPAVRMAIGLLCGAGLLVVCELKAARRYRVTANALDGAAIAILFATFFASHALWHLVGATPSFLFMALVTAVAVLLSIRRDSIFIAILGLLGGFATPALLSTGEDRPFGLFGYLALLNVGLAWVAYRKKWPQLAALASLFTVVYQWAWVLKFLSAQRLPLAFGIFLLFPVLAFIGLVLGRRQALNGETSAPFENTASLAALAPLFFTFYLASSPAFGASWGLLFGFLFLLVAGLFAVAVWRGPALLHAAGAASTLVVFAVWVWRSYAPPAWPGILWFVVLFDVCFLLAPWLAGRLRRPLGPVAEATALAGPLLLFMVPALLYREPASAAPLLPFTVLFVLALANSAYAILRRAGSVHFLAAFFALAAQAVWSALYLTPARLLPALGVYAVFALLYLGVPLLARARSAELRPSGGAVVTLLAGIVLLFFLTTGSVAGNALWGLALLLVVLNVGLFVEGTNGPWRWAPVLGAGVSWVVLAVWWARAGGLALLVPGLVVATCFAGVLIAGGLWSGKSQATPAPGPGGSHSLYLALIGHAFLAFVALQPELALPPWPVLAVMAVLNLALGAAALYLRRAEPHVAALLAAAVVLLVFVQSSGREAPWPSVAAVAAAGLSVFALLWIALAQRRVSADRVETFVHGAVVMLFLAQVVAVATAFCPGAPGLSLSIALYLGIATALLALSAAWERPRLAPVTAVASFASLALWKNASDPSLRELLLFAGLVYLLFLVYPLVLGRRVKTALGPDLAACLAGAGFFLLLRPALSAGGFAAMIGLLPIAQAIASSVLFARLLRLEPAGARQTGRLALVAGMVLSFVTVAIPLQLDRQWITVGWALEGAALAWLWTRIRHRGLALASVALLVTAFVRLALNPAVLTYHPRAETPLWNWYLYAYAVTAAALFFAARWLGTKSEDLGLAIPPPSRWLPALGTVLLFLLVNIEVADYFSTGPVVTFRLAGGASLAQDLAYTLAWAVFAVAMLGAGVFWSSRAARISAIAVLAATALKAFLHDLGRLGGLYRVASFVGLAVSLALVALALQKFVLARKGDSPP